MSYQIFRLKWTRFYPIAYRDEILPRSVQDQPHQTVAHILARPRLLASCATAGDAFQAEGGAVRRGGIQLVNGSGWNLLDWDYW